MKKLNKSRQVRGGMYWPKWYKTGSDYTKIDLQLWDIRLVLQDLKSRLVFSHLRLKHAVLVMSSKQEKAELRFQKRILDEHIKQIDKLLEENKLEELFECGKGHPIILKRFLGGDISLETFVIFDIIFLFSDKFDEKLLDPVRETVSLKIRKYKPFLSINVFQFKKILREIVEV